VENYRNRFGFYPAKVLADKIYCTKSNRKWLKGKTYYAGGQTPGPSIRKGSCIPRKTWIAKPD
jgi:hypothetical protein